MCNTYSESGKPCGVHRCEEYEALKQERDALLKMRDELIDIAHGQTMFDEFSKRYTHSFMSDGEALWRLLGFDDKRPYIPEAEFDAAVQRFKEARDGRV